MIFLLLGAPVVFAMGIGIGISITILFVILFLSFTNNIPLTSPMHICVSMFLQFSKFWFKLTRKSFRINDKNVTDSINISKLNKIPYIRVLPMTTPSPEAQFWDNLLFKEKQNLFVSELKKPYNKNRISLLRDHMKFSEPMFTLINSNLCKIRIETVKNIPIHWIEYEGSSIDNGIILCIHGGGYVAGMPSMQYALCSELSKLTGCVCISIEYRLCPDNGVTIKDSLNDCFSIYKYLILNRIVSSSKKICIMGESAGGGLSLLLLQKIRDYNNTSHRKLSHYDSDSDSDNDLDQIFIGNPGCCWLNSPWTNLEMNSKSITRNHSIDAMLANDPNKYFQRMSIGEIDINLNKRNKNITLKDKQFSPLYGEFHDLPPIYFMVGATEMLLDDTLESAKKAFDAGNNVKVDIEPFMHHTWPLFLRTLPEAKYPVIRASDFIINHLKICQ